MSCCLFHVLPLATVVVTTVVNQFFVLSTLLSLDVFDVSVATAVVVLIRESCSSLVSVILLNFDRLWFGGCSASAAGNGNRLVTVVQDNFDFFIVN